MQTTIALLATNQPNIFISWDLKIHVPSSCSSCCGVHPPAGKTLTTIALLATNRPGVPPAALTTYRGSLVDGQPVPETLTEAPGPSTAPPPADPNPATPPPKKQKVG
jgi:hypothetical protein